MDPGAFGTFVEELGYESVWTGEIGSDSFVDLTQVALRTEKVRVGTALVNVFCRSPLEIAMSGVSLNRVSDGRAVIGIGASHPGKVVDRHGLEYSRPLHRTHETVELIKGHTTNGGEEFDYDGEIFQLKGLPSLDAEFPVYNGALGEANRRLTGTLCDGWIPFNIPIPKLEDSFQTIADAARKVGRDPDDIEVVPKVQAAVSDDPEEARYYVRRIIAQKSGGHRDNTYRSAMGQLFPEESDRLAELWRAGKKEKAIRSVPDEMVDALGIAGTPEYARKRLRELVDLPVVDTPILRIPKGADERLVKRTVIELSPELL